MWRFLVYSVIFTAVLTLSNFYGTSANFLETILFTQYDDASSLSCGGGGKPLNYAPFEGGDSYFNEQFQSLVKEVKSKSKELNKLDVKKRSLAPPAMLINDAYSKLVDVENRIITGFILLGENSDVVFCYRDGIYSSCTDNEQRLYETTTLTMWSYSYGCDGWRATLVHASLRPHSSSVTKVVFSITVDLKDIDINQCSNSTDSVFVNTALCPPDIAQCIHKKGAGFVIGSYLCQCLQCTECGNITGAELSSPSVNATVVLRDHCTAQKPTDGAGASTLRLDFMRVEVYVLLAIQGLCVLMCLTFAILVFVYRSAQVFSSAKWLLLELVLLGAVLKYLLLLWLALQPSDVICVIYQWFSEISFMCMYGSVILKIYKEHAEYQVKQKQVKNRDLTIYWLVCMLVIIIYLSSWTAVVCNYLSVHGISLTTSLPLSNSVTLPSSNTVVDVEQPFTISVATHIACALAGWSYVTQIAELLVIICGLYMLIKLRHQKSLYSENMWYCIVLVIELVTSIVYYIIGDTLVVESYWNLLMTFMYHQLTVTLVLLLIFGPKFYHIKRGAKLITQDAPAEVNELNIQVTSPNDVELELKKANDEIDMLRARIMKYVDQAVVQVPEKHQNVDRNTKFSKNKPKPNWEVKDVACYQEAESLQVASGDEQPEAKSQMSPRRKSSPRHTAM